MSKAALVQDDPHAFARARVPEGRLLDLVAIVLQNHGLDAKLDALGLVGAAGDVGSLALLEVHGHGHAVAGLHHVHLGDHAETL